MLNETNTYVFGRQTCKLGLAVSKRIQRLLEGMVGRSSCPSCLRISQVHPRYVSSGCEPETVSRLWEWMKTPRSSTQVFAPRKEQARKTSPLVTCTVRQWQWKSLHRKMSRAAVVKLKRVLKWQKVRKKNTHKRNLAFHAKLPQRWNPWSRDLEQRLDPEAAELAMAPCLESVAGLGLQ